MKINPMIDFAFKFIFGSEQNKDILIDFLNATLKDSNKIKDLTILNPFNLKEHLNDKLSILDIKAQLENGTYVNVEVQLVNQKDMKNRTLYYWSRMYSGQLNESEAYYKLQKTITINIMDFVLLEETKKYHTVYHLREDEENFSLTDLMEIHMIEIPKLLNKSESLNDQLVEWLLFLENPDNKNMEELAMKNPKIKKAMTVLEFISSDKKAREYYEARQKEIRDEISRRMFAEEEGLKKGMEKGMDEGIKKGREEGEHIKAVKMAKSMLSDGLDLSMISKYTQLGMSELREIKATQEQI